MCKEEEGLSIKWIFNRTNKFQSSGEIESAHEFEGDGEIRIWLFLT